VNFVYGKQSRVAGDLTGTVPFETGLHGHKRRSGSPQLRQH
jgi:hypothetical protein